MKSNGRKHGGSRRDSIVLDALLQHVGAHPDVLRPIDAGLIERLYALIEGVEVDLNQRLPTELEDPGMP